MSERTSPMTSRMTRMRPALRIVLAVGMVAIGIAHFVAPEAFASIIPRFLPAPVTLVLVSGFFEIAGGVGLLVPRVRRLASLGLVALYVAVFPANLNMALTGAAPPGVHVSTIALWLRLPFQIVFIVWALWVGRDVGRDAVDAQALNRGR
jgi:uncharacterized membrane protein